MMTFNNSLNTLALVGAISATLVAQSAGAAALFVSSGDNNRILQFGAGPTSGNPGSFFAGAGLAKPYGLAVGPDGNLYVANDRSGAAGDDIKVYDGQTGAPLGTFATAGVNAPRDIAFRSNGNLLVSVETGADLGVVREYDGATGVLIDSFISTANLDRPQGLAFGPTGELFVASDAADDSRDKINRYDANGMAVDLSFAGLNDPLLVDPRDIAFGPDGHLYVVSAGLELILRYNGINGDPLPAAGSRVLSSSMTP